jgi:hypothetical protein
VSQSQEEAHEAGIKCRYGTSGAASRITRKIATSRLGTRRRGIPLYHAGFCASRSLGAGNRGVLFNSVEVLDIERATNVGCLPCRRGDGQTGKRQTEVKSFDARAGKPLRTTSGTRSRTTDRGLGASTPRSRAGRARDGT